MAKTGRPSSFTKAIGEEICARLALGESLGCICKSEHLPTRQTVYNWCVADRAFFDEYTKAREIGLDKMADDLLEIADDGSNDWMAKNDPENPGYVANGEHHARSRLRVDTRKWYLSKLAPKRFGERVALEHTGADGGPIETKDVSQLEVARRMAMVLGQGVALAAAKTAQGSTIDNEDIVG